VFIGQHGQTLDSIETLVAHTVSRRFPRWVMIYVDTDKYRQKRQSFLENLIKKVVREIEKDHRERPVKGLLPKERKFVHQFFAEHPYLTTESRGKGPNRTLYVTPRSDIQEV
jgi:spoIIIJ-associated protein